MRWALALALLVLLGFLLGADVLMPVEPTGQLVQGGGLLAFAWAVYRSGEKLGERILEAIAGLKEAFLSLSGSVRDVLDRLSRLEIQVAARVSEIESSGWGSSGPDRPAPHGTLPPPTR